MTPWLIASPTVAVSNGDGQIVGAMLYVHHARIVAAPAAQPHPGELRNRGRGERGAER